MCQCDFQIEEINCLVRTTCCSTLIHRRCHDEMAARTSAWGICHFEAEPDQPRPLELPADEEEDEEFDFDSFNGSLEVLIGDLEDQEDDDLFALPPGMVL